MERPAAADAPANESYEEDDEVESQTFFSYGFGYLVPPFIVHRRILQPTADVEIHQDLEN